MEQEQGGFHGMRMWLIIGGIAVVAYLFLSRKSSSSGSAGSPKTTGGGGTVSSSGATTLQKGAVTVTVTQTTPNLSAHEGRHRMTGNRDVDDPEKDKDKKDEDKKRHVFHPIPEPHRRPRRVTHHAKGDS